MHEKASKLQAKNPDLKRSDAVRKAGHWWSGLEEKEKKQIVKRIAGAEVDGDDAADKKKTAGAPKRTAGASKRAQKEEEEDEDEDDDVRAGGDEDDSDEEFDSDEDEEEPRAAGHPGSRICTCHLRRSAGAEEDEDDEEDETEAAPRAGGLRRNAKGQFMPKKGHKKKGRKSKKSPGRRRHRRAAYAYS